MPETYGMPEHGFRGNIVAEWAFLEARDSGTRPDLLEDVTFDEEGEPVPEPIAGSRRSRKTAEKARAAIAEAMGVDIEDAPDIDYSDMDAIGDVVVNDLTDPQDAWQALDAALDERTLTRGHEEPATDEEVRQARRTVDLIERTVERAKAGEGSRAYVVREQSWREERGMPRKRKNRNAAPSRSSEARRAERIRAKARQFGISVEEADAMTPRVSAIPNPQEVSPHGIDNPTDR